MAGIKEATRDMEILRPNSTPSSVGKVPLGNYGDCSIDICSVPSSSNPSVGGHHPQAPFDASSSTDQSLVIKRVHLVAWGDKWEDAKDIFYKYPEMVRTPLAKKRDTALHVAVRSYSLDFVKEFVNLVTAEDLAILNSDGNTAFCIAAISDCPTHLLQLMTDKNPQLPLIRGQDGMLPVHLAALYGHSKVADHLSSDDLLGKMEKKDIERLFLLTVRSDIYDVAIKLFDNPNIDGDGLFAARDDQNLTALHMLARKPKDSGSFDFFSHLWNHVNGLEYSVMMQVISIPSLVLFDAIESGKDDEAIHILYDNIRLLTLQDSSRRNVLHCAAEHGREKILSHAINLGRGKNIIRAVDLEGNNVLHAAAKYQSQVVSSTFNTKLQRELEWFQIVTMKVDLGELTRMRNNRGMTPMEMFYAMRGKESGVDKETARGIAKSGMVVAALIATIAFAAALTVPRDKTSAWFVVFILTNTIALCTSSASIISFLSIFTSPLSNSPLFDQLTISLTPINLGLGLVIVSVVAMIISFGAASFLIFGHQFKWAAYIVVALGLLPILMLLILRSNYLRRLRSRFFLRH